MSAEDIQNQFEQTPAIGIRPTPLQRPLPKAEPFPVDALGNQLSLLANKIAEVVQAPSAICCQSILAAVALAVQGHADIFIDGRIIPLPEFFVTIGASGERKSAIDSLALLPHRTHQDGLRDFYQTAYTRWKVEFEAYESAKKDFLRKNKTLLEKKSLIEHLGYPPPQPLSPILLTEEPTYEGLIKLLVNGQPSIGLFSDEGGRFIGGHGMNQDNLLKTAAGLCSFWDGKPISRVRAGEESILLCGKRLSFHLMAQPKVAELMLSNKILIEQGLLSRCLISWPSSTAGSRFYKPIDLTTAPEYTDYIRLMTNILKLSPRLAPGKINELSPRKIELAPEAKIYFIGFHDEIESQLGENGIYNSIKGFANKAPEHALRLAGIISLFYDINCIQIPVEHMISGIRLTQHYLDEALRLFHSSVADDDIIQSEALLHWLHESKKSVTFLSDIYQFGPASIRNARTARKSMQLLVDHGWAYALEDGITIEKNHHKEAWKIIAAQ